jgi:hypothetical protein
LSLVTNNDVLELTICYPSHCAVYTYYKSLPFSTAAHAFNPTPPTGKAQRAFVSAVCWTRQGRHCLAANSQGEVRVLKLQ